MRRTQLSLEDWQFQALKSMAVQQGRSVSQIVRDILTQTLRRSGADRLTAMEGIVDVPGVNGRDHDQVIYDSDSQRE